MSSLVAAPTPEEASELKYSWNRLVKRDPKQKAEMTLSGFGFLFSVASFYALASIEALSQS